MNLKVLMASFVVVFLAELGDKTQLTALAYTTSTRSPMSVFVGTSLALVAATAMAVLLGDLLTRHVPQQVLHIVSAVMFVLIGLVLLVNVARKAPVAKEMETGQLAPSISGGGILFSVVMRQAAVFEEDMVKSLEKLLTKVHPASETHATLEMIIAQDRRHLQSIRDWGKHPVAEEAIAGIAPAAVDSLAIRLEGTDPEPNQVILEALRAEEAAADFYLALSRMCRIHEVRDAFRLLAQEEIGHVQALCALVNHVPNDPVSI